MAPATFYFSSGVPEVNNPYTPVTTKIERLLLVEKGRHHHSQYWQIWHLQYHGPQGYHLLGTLSTLMLGTK